MEFARTHMTDGWICASCAEKNSIVEGGGWDYDGNKRADNCPLMEVSDDK